MSKSRLMKEGLDRAAVNRIGSSLEKAWPSFNKKSFITSANKGLNQLELKERVNHIIEVLDQHLPKPFKQKQTILKLLKKHWDYGDPDDPVRGFAAWPVIDYLSVYGLDTPRESLQVLEELTELFSAEFAIRTFLEQHREVTTEIISCWAHNSNEHVRRLASEGSRPRLPWGMRLQFYIEDPTPLLPLLDKLKDDSSLYVRRSVANSLNDISKDHSDLVIATGQRWLQEKSLTEEQSVNRQWIVRHALRSLIKQGDPRVFPLLGYTHNPQIKIGSLKLATKEVAMGDKLEFFFDLISLSNKNQKMVVDYVIHHQKANGKTSPKVFKFKNIKIEKGQRQSHTKKHSFKEVTTRKYYKGKHKLEIKVNGVVYASKAFELV